MSRVYPTQKRGTSTTVLILELGDDAKSLRKGYTLNDGSVYTYTRTGNPKMKKVRYVIFIPKRREV